MQSSSESSLETTIPWRYSSTAEATEVLRQLVEEYDSNSKDSPVSDETDPWPSLDNLDKSSDEARSWPLLEETGGTEDDELELRSHLSGSSDTAETPTPLPLLIRKRHGLHKSAARKTGFSDLPGSVRSSIFKIFLREVDGGEPQLKAHIWFCAHLANDFTALPFWTCSIRSKGVKALRAVSKQINVELTGALIPYALCRVSLCDFASHAQASPMRVEHMQQVKRVVVEAKTWRLAYEQYCGARSHWLATRMMYTLKYLDLELFGLEADPDALFGQNWRLSTAAWHEVHNIEATFSHQLGVPVRLVKAETQAAAGQREHKSTADEACRWWMEKELDRLVLHV